MFKIVPTGFIPTQDQGYLIVNVQMPDASSIERTHGVMTQLANLAFKTQGIQDAFAVSGFSILTGANSSAAGLLFVHLTPFAERAGKTDLTADAIAKPAQRNSFSKVEGGAGPSADRRRAVAGLETPAVSRCRLRTVPALRRRSSFRQRLNMLIDAAHSTPAAGQVVLHLPRQRSADLRQRRSRQGQAAERRGHGRLSRRCKSTLAGFTSTTSTISVERGT